jgi:hypothetical protein
VYGALIGIKLQTPKLDNGIGIGPKGFYPMEWWVKMYVKQNTRMSSSFGYNKAYQN